MAAGEHGHKELFDDLVLADDHPGQLAGDQSAGFGQLLGCLNIIFMKHL